MLYFFYLFFVAILDSTVLGSFDYGYFYEQSLYTRAAIAVAINTSLVALASWSDLLPILKLVMGFICLFVVWILVGKFENCRRRKDNSPKYRT